MHNITLTKKGIRLFSCLIRYHVGLHMLPVQMLTVRGFSIQYSNYVTFTYLVYLWDIQKPCTYILTYVDLCKYFSKMLTNLKNRFLHSSFNVKVTQLSKTHQFSLFIYLLTWYFVAYEQWFHLISWALWNKRETTYYMFYCIAYKKY